MAVKVVDPKFINSIAISDDFNAQACMSCGVCTAICPMETGILARKLFRYVLLGLKDKLVEHEEEIFSCLLCKLCEQTCPADVHIAENIRLIRRYLTTEVYKI